MGRNDVCMVASLCVCVGGCLCELKANLFCIHLPSPSQVAPSVTEG